MAWLFVLVAIVMMLGCLAYVANRPTPQLTIGDNRQIRWLNTATHRFYFEQVSFADYHQALHHYFEIIPQFHNQAGLQEMKYSYLDWTDTLLRFDNYSLQLVRKIDKIQLIKSTEPMSLAQFEQQIAELAKQGDLG